MLIIYILLIIIIMFIFLSLGLSIYLAVAIAICIIMSVEYVILFINKKRNNLLREKCNPEAYLVKLEKLLKIYKYNSHLRAIIIIQISVAYENMGEYKKALHLLSSIDKNQLYKKTNQHFIYYSILSTYLYKIGNLEAAEDIFKKEIEKFFSSNQRIMLSKKSFLADRLFYRGKYEESREIYLSLLKEDFSLCTRVDILYHLALIDEVEGKTEDALEKFREVAEKGNKLYIAQQARLKLGM